MKKCLYPGSFDPFTNGHLNVVRKASSIFDKVIIGIGYNESKIRRFDRNDMKRAIEEVIKCENIKNVEVCMYEGLTFRAVENFGADIIVKGVRNIMDYQYEENNAIENEEVSEIDTFYIRGGKLSTISSSFVYALLRNGEDVSKYVPKSILNIIK